MSPAIEADQWVVVHDVGEGGHLAPERGDVVLFRFPLGTDGRAVKRIIAVAGDVVAFTDERVTVNGDTSAIAGSPAASAEARTGTVTVPPGNVFVLGDNAIASIDSRSFGTVPESEVVGIVRYVIPQRPAGAMLGSGVLVLLGVVLLIAAWRRRPGGARPRRARRRCAADDAVARAAIGTLARWNRPVTDTGTRTMTIGRSTSG
jgi:signal peptidase I